jgi:hypothetical protein
MKHSKHRTQRKDYEVGYGKPPKHTQFGASGGNKKCRKANGPVPIDIFAALERPLEVNKGGKRTKMSPLEAGLRSLVKAAINDRDLRAILEILKLCEKYGLIAAPSQQFVSGGVLVIPKSWDYDAWSDMLNTTGRAPSPDGGIVVLPPDEMQKLKRS